MRRIFIATHSTLASGVKSSLTMLLGKTDNITFFDAYVDDRNLEEETQKAYDACNPEDQFFILTDLVGGSVHNTLIPYIERENVFLISGFNLALVLELCIMLENNYTVEQICNLIRNSQKAMQWVKSIPEFTEEELFEEG